MKTLLLAPVAGILLIFLDVKANEEGPLQKIYLHLQEDPIRRSRLGMNYGYW